MSPGAAGCGAPEQLPAESQVSYTVVPMKRSSRNAVASAAVALCPASFGARLYLFYSDLSSRPQSPNPELGFVQSLNNHGSYVYVTDAESTGLALLSMAFMAGLLLALAIVPKDFILPPRGTPKWLTYVSAAAKTDLANPSKRLMTIFLSSLAFYLAVIILAGLSIADFLVSKGIVLDL